MTTDATPPSRILVVEDDAVLLDQLERLLRREGHVVVGVRTGRRASQELTASRPDLVLLDLGLPDVRGEHLLAAVAQDRRTPVLVLSGSASPDERAAGLELGADDYLGKPFHSRELVARVNRLLERGGRTTAPRGHLVVGSLHLDAAARTVQVSGCPVELTRREFDLLLFLAVNRGVTFTRGDLLRHVWGSDPDWQDVATVNEHVRRLRSKLGVAAAAIETVRGHGYRLTADDGAQPDAGG